MVIGRAITIQIKAYNIEIIIAEKIETIIFKSVLKTRDRDYYDIYILSKIQWHLINERLLVEAIYRKFEERDSMM